MVVILFSSLNPASKNIALNLIRSCPFERRGEEWFWGNIRLLDTRSEITEVPTDFDTDYLIVLSSHKAEKKRKMLTAHFPGNWRDAKYGGKPRCLNVAWGSRLKILIEELKKANTLGWPIYIEADHHGPLSNLPIIFVEIGSTEEEWKDKRAGLSVALAVKNAVRRNESYRSFFGVGGGHYAIHFTDIVLRSEYAVGHIAPKYVLDDIDLKLFKEAIEKNVERVEDVFVLRKETNTRQRNKIRSFCSLLGIRYSEV